MAFPSIELSPPELLARYHAIRRRSQRLVEPLEPEDCSVQTMPDVSPTKWHLAHTTWFFETFVLRRWVPGYEASHPMYEVLFNSYYDTVGPQHPRPERGNLSRPTLREVLDYRHHVDAAMSAFLDQDGDPGRLFVVETGLQHEQQHQELLLMDIKHVLGTNPLRPPYDELRSREQVELPELAWHGFDGGTVEIGHDGDGFAFDNERPRHAVHVEPFVLASRPVSNREFREFIEDGGYQRPELWLADGFTAVQRESWQMPLYWRRRGDLWLRYGLGGEHETHRNEPVCHLSYYEADAFARWHDARLPTEAEWELASAAVAVEGNFADDGYLDPLPSTGQGLEQMFGDVWEFTSSAYSPYPGFEPLDGSLGEYNGKFMVNQVVLRGGSCATPRGHVRRTYRNFFYPWMRWQFGGLRLARSVQGKPVP